MQPVRACALSDVGRSRRVNEDFFALEPDHGLYLVADGMGGHGNGEIASRLAVDAIRGCYAEASPRGGSNGEVEALRAAIARANDEVLRAVRGDETLVGMGTTLVALKLLGGGGRVAVAHVGDSRAYRLRDGHLKLLTEDHTWVNEQISAGNISESQARRHPFKSVVTRALGGEERVEVAVAEWGAEDGDLYLLCSDGLTTMVEDEAIRSRLAGWRELEPICRRLVDDANAAGGRDNVTVLLVAVGA